MKHLIKHMSVVLLMCGLFFACRGGVHKNNDHDYDGKNENNDHPDNMSDEVRDTAEWDSTGYTTDSITKPYGDGK